jgi:HNH endonuclease
MVFTCYNSKLKFSCPLAVRPLSAFRTIVAERARIPYLNATMKKCAQCNSEIPYNQKNPGRSKFCSKICYLGFHKIKTETRTCRNCGADFSINVFSKNKTCSKMCKYGYLKECGHEYIGSNGYVYVKTHSQFSEPSGGYELKHRVVMRKHIGRELSSLEHVHHINENKTDNRIENLRIVSPSEHASIHYSSQVINSKCSIKKRVASRRRNNVCVN